MTESEEQSCERIVREGRRARKHQAVMMMKVFEKIKSWKSLGGERRHQKCEVWYSNLMKTAGPQLPSGERAMGWKHLGSSGVS